MNDEDFCEGMPIFRPTEAQKKQIAVDLARSLQHQPISGKAGIDQFAERVISQIEKLNTGGYGMPMIVRNAAIDIIKQEASKAEEVAVCWQCNSTNVNTAHVHQCKDCLVQYASKFNSGLKYRWSDAQQPQPAEPDHVARELAAAHSQNSEAIARGWATGSPLDAHRQPENLFLQDDEPIAQPAQDSRAEFEAWANNKGLSTLRHKKCADNYEDRDTRYAFEGWQARAQGDAVDAARYRALRNADNQLLEDDISVSDSSFNVYFDAELDAAVDALIERAAAIAADKEKA